MKNEAKARKLIEEIYPSKSLGDYGLKEQLLLEAMEWKDKQFSEKTKQWVEYLECALQGGVHPQGVKGLIEQFKQAMEE